MPRKKQDKKDEEKKKTPSDKKSKKKTITKDGIDPTRSLAGKSLDVNRIITDIKEGV